MVMLVLCILIRKGNFIGETLIPSGYRNYSERRCIDVAIDDYLNCYLLETYSVENSRKNRLVKTDKDGNVLWDIQGLGSSSNADFYILKGDFNRLLIGKSSTVYLASMSQMNTIALIDTDTGGISKIFALQNGTEEKLFTDGSGTILRTLFFAQQNRYGMTAFNPDSNEEISAVGNDELYGLLQFPFGVDNQNNFYAYKLPNVYEIPGIMKISLEGKATQLVEFKDLLVRPSDDTVFVHYNTRDTSEIVGYYKDGAMRQWSLHMPEKCAPDTLGMCKLITVDEGTRFYFHTDEKPGTLGKLLIFSEHSTLDEERTPPFDLLSMESSVQPFIYWQVDSGGRIYFPIIDPQGFKVIRFSSEPTEL